jgi:hypothetical protein
VAELRRLADHSPSQLTPAATLVTMRFRWNVVGAGWAELSVGEATERYRVTFDRVGDGRPFPRRELERLRATWRALPA